MGLRCLLGHDFGPSGVVREHEEDGNEMVVIEREIRRCRRCNEEQVLSESKEVRAIRAEDEVRADRRDAEAVAPASSTQGPVGVDGGGSPDATPLDGDGGTPVTDGTDGTAGEIEGRTPDTAALEDEEESNTSLIERAEAGFDDPEPGEEDAVILDDTDDGPEREHGAWPDSGDVGGPVAPEEQGDADPEADHDVPEAGHDVSEASNDDPGTDDATPERPDAAGDASRSVAETAAEEDAELLDAGGDDGLEDAPPNGGGTDRGGPDDSWPAHTGEDEGFAAGQASSGGPGIAYGNTIAPQSGPANGESRDDGYETSYIDTTVEERDGDGTIVSAGSDRVVEPGPGVQTEYYCPSCGQAWPLDSSLRTGDICPECQTGYVAERER
jgi:hypothetical protein